jgi:hypothetical protein
MATPASWPTELPARKPFDAAEDRPMAKHRSSRWKRLRDSIAIDPAHVAAGSAVIDTLGLLALEAEKWAVLRQSERLGAAGAGQTPSVQPRTGNAPCIGCGDIK